MASEHHLFEIPANQLQRNFAFATSWTSRIGGSDWQCDFRTSDTVSFSLVLPAGGNIHSEPLNARLKFSLLDREGRPVPSRTRAISFRNWSTDRRWERACADFITMEDLERPEYLKDGRFRVRCDIALAPPSAPAKAADAFVTVPPSDLHRHLGDLLACEEGADVTFQVAGGETFSAHRAVLAARSPVFRAQLFGQMKESKQTAAAGGGAIEIGDMEAPVFRALLSYIYTGSLPEADEEQDQDKDDDGAMVRYQHLLADADRYGLERMKLICQEKLCNHVHASSVAGMLALADRHHCPGLKLRRRASISSRLLEYQP
ncbi:BTB/POZ and MATH domain-containing protein 1-like [Panicum virgatum]|uniref:BTB domain-containing protein n=1 Tax=Panicum virgatum TaxID=38727 RepID=A0A8T0SZD2_PANVG|nr:BTB/POZ and MATH domain-containing protein 1-like [Panicum virgatum]KAG2604171.1 hypothetical protein PVAP13_4NG049600 [Panicum virgatum]